MESPYFGWIVPYEWQEPDYGDDLEGEQPEDCSDFDDEGAFTL
jgi:hypothetical protein